MNSNILNVHIVSNVVNKKKYKLQELGKLHIVGTTCIKISNF